MKLINLLEGKNLIGCKINQDDNQRSSNSENLIEITSKIKIWPTSFDCDKRGLDSLVGAPAEVKGYFSCMGNHLKNLKGGPKIIRFGQTGGNYLCSHNDLTSLEGVAEIIEGNFRCGYNHNLMSLKDIHKQIKEMRGIFYADDDNFESHLLGILYIKGCTKVEFSSPSARAVPHDTYEIARIMNKYLPNHRGHKSVFECQCELQDAGFDEYAQL